MPSQLYKDVKKGLPSSVVVLEANEGDQLTVSIDVNEMQYPYSVHFDQSTVIFSFTDRKEQILDLKPGVHELSWAFVHRAKNWKHDIKAKVDGKAFKTLDSRSEKNKDRPYSSNVAFIVVNS